MNRISQTLLSSICKCIKKECIMGGKMIPHDHILSYVLKLFILGSPPHLEDENDMKRYAAFVINSVSSFIESSNTSMITIEIQMYFVEHHITKENVLEKRNEVVKQSTDTFLRHILSKRVTKNKEDMDQLYHLISCYVILISGAGDPTDEEILKETTVALKSILSSKEIIRFSLKAASVKEKQLGDVCNIVTGIRIFNKDSAQKSANKNEMLSHLQKAFQKCSNFLELKSRQIAERSQQITRICLLQQDSTNPNESAAENLRELKSYAVLLQQILVYFCTLNSECLKLREEFQTCRVILEQRLTRVRKTVKCRTAIPVVEIYPQFKDISLSWDKMQELSVLLNHLSDIIYDICEIFDKVSEPNLENLPERMDNLSSKKYKDNISVENSNCELVKAELADDFYNISIEFSGYCVVTFVEAKGVLTSGIKEYGLIKFKDKHYSFSTPTNASKFCMNPEKYINEIRTLIVIWPETIHLLNLERDLAKVESSEEVGNTQLVPTVANAEVQTEIHPIASFKDYSYTSSVWQLRQRIIHLAELKKYRTHSVQTIESNFRKNSSTQTDRK